MDNETTLKVCSLLDWACIKAQDGEFDIAITNIDEVREILVNMQVKESNDATN